MNICLNEKDGVSWWKSNKEELKTKYLLTDLSSEVSFVLNDRIIKGN